jgi:hypothetical protein
MVYNWNDEKNRELITERDISFEEVVAYIESGHLLDTIEHPNLKKYPNQKVHIVNINSYIYLVPFVFENEFMFLKTIIPSRKFTKLYLGESNG